MAAAPGARSASLLDLAARLSSALGKRAGREDGGGDSGTDPCEGGEGGAAEGPEVRTGELRQRWHSLTPSQPDAADEDAALRARLFDARRKAFQGKAAAAFAGRRPPPGEEEEEKEEGREAAHPMEA